MKQKIALDILKSGKNVFLTGSAGAGKTYTLNKYINYLKARRIPVAITASTGIAATHMNGMTIHTWSGIGIKDSLDTKDLKSMADRKYLQKHLEHVAVLIIDEISMLHANQFNMVNQVLKYFKENDTAFGDIQIIVAGDFFQLPPIGRQIEKNRDKFCFMSESWVDASFKVCYLTEQHRQTDTADAGIGLNDILNEIRSGKVSHQAITTLKNTHSNLTENGIDEQQITKLYTHNADVDSINKNQLVQLTTKPKVYTAKLTGNEKMLMTLEKSVRSPEHLTLKVGTKVMFVKNNFEQGFSNGTLGEVTGFHEDTETGIMPEVLLKNGRSLIVTPENWSVDDEKGNPIASFTQLPLCYAWAITVHKSQGMTLEQAEIDLSQTFEAGQGYVALSRLKSLDGLRLLGLNDTALRLDSLAMKADKRFLELSDEIETVYADKSAKELEKVHKKFIMNNGGTTSEYIIGQYGKKAKHKQKSDYGLDTLEETRTLLVESLTIAEIASAREIAESTVVNHISKLLKDLPGLPIGHIKPDDELIEIIQKAYDKVKKRDRDDDKTEAGDIRLRPIFIELKEEIPYNVIRLALLFIQ